MRKLAISDGLRQKKKESGSTELYFSDHMKFLCEHIQQAEEIYGCVFNFTNRKVIDTLKNVKNCQILVDKRTTGSIEDYGQLRCEKRAEEFLSKYPQAFNDGRWNDRLEPVRVVGSCRDNEGLMHSKFLIFVRNHDRRGNKVFQPYAVWMGSVNFSYNANRNCEVATFTKNRKLAKSMFEHYIEILARSESIYDYEQEFNPQWWQRKF